MNDDKIKIEILPEFQDYIDFLNTGIEIERNSEFLETAKAASDFLKGLDLPCEQNNELIRLMAAHSRAAEKNGFLQGLQWGDKLGRLRDGISDSL